MNQNNLLWLVVGWVVMPIAFVGCAPTAATTPPSPSGTPSATPTASATEAPTVTTTPEPTLDPDQAAAVKVAEAYEAALAKIRSDPPRYGQYKMIEMLKPLAFDDMIQANLNGIQSWRDHDWHEQGSHVILSRRTAPPSITASGTVRVNVTLCKDQRNLVVVDKKGKEVTAKQVRGPDFLQNTYDMRRTTDSEKFKVYEFGGDEVSGCSQ